MQQVVSVKALVGGTLGVLDLLQEWVANHETFTGVCGDHMGNYDVLRELLGSHLETEVCDE